MDAWECALGFMDSQALLTAEKLNLFTLLERGEKTTEELSKALNLPRDSTQRLLNLLCSLGFVQCIEKSRYKNSTEASEKLVRGKPDYIGDMFVHIRDELYPLWGHLHRSLGENRSLKDELLPTTTEEWFSQPEKVEAFMRGMHTITYQTGKEFAQITPELSGLDFMVDVGGAAGSFLIALAQTFPRLRGTILDLDYAEPIARKFIDEFGLQKQLSFHTADFFTDPLPEGADAYTLGYILHDWDTEQGDQLLDSISKASRPGAMLVIGEYLLNEDKTGPRHVVRADLNMMVAARGRERSRKEYAEWIARHGFRLSDVKTTPSYNRAYMLAYRK
ncbi:MAG: methyltransferase [Chitinispirillaceae bacterium]